ncbi:MAG: hypothetical protein ACO2Y1_08820 [Flavobacteriaceae bacterium]
MQRLKKIDTAASPSPQGEVLLLQEGMEVEHARFGSGRVKTIEGKGNDQKAVIDFKGFGEKNLLLRFAKLKIK